jgi:hypothetical protein
MHRELLRIAAGYEATGIDRSKALAKNFDEIARQSHPQLPLVTR